MTRFLLLFSWALLFTLIGSGLFYILLRLKHQNKLLVSKKMAWWILAIYAIVLLVVSFIGIEHQWGMALSNSCCAQIVLIGFMINKMRKKHSESSIS